MFPCTSNENGYRSCMSFYCFVFMHPHHHHPTRFRFPPPGGCRSQARILCTGKCVHEAGSNGTNQRGCAWSWYDGHKTGLGNWSGNGFSTTNLFRRSLGWCCGTHFPMPNHHMFSNTFANRLWPGPCGWRRDLAARCAIWCDRWFLDLRLYRRFQLRPRCWLLHCFCASTA